MKKPLINDWVVRWILLLYEYIMIINKSSKANVVANFLSRIPIVEDFDIVQDKLLDEYLFALLASNPWYVDITNYLVTGHFPPHLSPWEWKQLIYRSHLYTWIDGLLFYVGINNIFCSYV